MSTGADDRERLRPAVDEPAESPSSAVAGAARRDFSTGSLWIHVLTFGSPLVVAMGFMALFNLIDIFIVGRLESAREAVQIVSICDALVTLFVVLVTGIGNAAHALIARAVGNGDQHAAKTASTQAMLITLVISALVFVLGAAAPDLTLRVLQVDPGSKLFQIGVDYLRIALMGGFTMFFVVMMTNMLRGIGNSVWPTTTLVLVNVLNIILAIVFVLGPENGVSFGFGWGVLGAAWAALAARIVGFVLMIVIFTVGVGQHYLHRTLTYWRPNPQVLKRLLKIGLPSSGQLIVRVGGILALVALVYGYLTTEADTTIGAAFTLCVKLDLVALFLALGWGQAAGTVVGQSIGSNKPERGIRAGWIAMTYGIVMTVVVGIVFFIYATPIVDFFFERAADDGPPTAVIEDAEKPLQEEAAQRWAELQRTISPPEGMLEAELGSLKWAEAQQAAAALPALDAFLAAPEDGGYRGTPAAGDAWLMAEETKHRLVIYHGSWYLRVMVFGWIVLGIGIILSQAMTGAGQTRTPVILDAIACLPLLLGLVILVNEITPLAGNRQPAAVGSWIAVAVSYALLAALYVVVFRGRRWLRSIPPHDPAEAEIGVPKAVLDAAGSTTTDAAAPAADPSPAADCGEPGEHHDRA